MNRQSIPGSTLPKDVGVSEGIKLALKALNR